MRTATVNFKTDQDVKLQAQGIAHRMGIPLGSLLNAYLRDFVGKQEVYFSLHEVKRSRTVKQIFSNLDDEERKEMRALLNMDNLKKNFSSVDITEVV